MLPIRLQNCLARPVLAIISPSRAYSPPMNAPILVPMYQWAIWFLQMLQQLHLQYDRWGCHILPSHVWDPEPQSAQSLHNKVASYKMSNSSSSASTKDESNGFPRNSPRQTNKIVHMRHPLRPNVACTTAISLDPALYLFSQVFKCCNCIWISRTSRLGSRNDKPLKETSEWLTDAVSTKLLPVTQHGYVDEPTVDSVIFWSDKCYEWDI